MDASVRSYAKPNSSRALKICDSTNPAVVDDDTISAGTRRWFFWFWKNTNSRCFKSSAFGTSDNATEWNLRVWVGELHNNNNNNNKCTNQNATMRGTTTTIDFLSFRFARSVGRSGLLFNSLSSIDSDTEGTGRPSPWLGTWRRCSAARRGVRLGQGLLWARRPWRARRRRVRRLASRRGRRRRCGAGRAGFPSRRRERTSE
mmetsp:Transcript_9358/g.30476  ORF Transcript_9358/g.30476 Transcript_9358/m.30476 type:complete len:202 (+) Transcript_9358:523-1128(+)